MSSSPLSPASPSPSASASASASTSQISFGPLSDNPSASHHLIYFITGNPGLIAYYDTFLRTLHELLPNISTSTASANNRVFHIYGQSLAGFDVDEQISAKSPSPLRESPYSLEDQIRIHLKALAEFRIQSGPRQGQLHDSVILIGHSVGSYILLEIIQRLRQHDSAPRIKAGILLFPTVTHIAKSPSGVKISTLFRIPNFPKRISTLVKALVWLLPKSFMERAVGGITRMPDDAAKVTTGFLRSRMGVWQALQMAKDEMETITEDRWDEDIWGIEHEEADYKAEIPKLIFYFGQNDHWVADHTRDALIAARAQTGGLSKSSKPIMLIDENGVDHGFCIRHSESIAEKVKMWIDTILSDL
ncbi:Uncharacterized protein BP5553_00573 [Venustampulla echinocandica]|uniref:Lipid droplet-associated hydrolase n=1 Tax=Venustampulla echinocandica TaxID=2656787 RepID=A0A370TYK2_9HELO|nr:Uncharacterized protein BP5553_00573 [Venustampulla echinocandica]RDL40594.1 Uncharacterized protein BP5553_00573 [Venustampulla echinocandica]